MREKLDPHKKMLKMQVLWYSWNKNAIDKRKKSSPIRISINVGKNSHVIPVHHGWEFGFGVSCAESYVGQFWSQWFPKVAAKISWNCKESRNSLRNAWTHQLRTFYQWPQYTTWVLLTESFNNKSPAVVIRTSLVAVHKIEPSFQFFCTICIILTCMQKSWRLSLLIFLCRNQ